MKLVLAKKIFGRNIGAKISGQNIGGKIFFIRKLVRKVSLRGQVLSRKIGAKNFYVFFSSKIGFKYLISVLNFLLKN